MNPRINSYRSNRGEISGGALFGIVVFLMLVVLMGMAGCPQYNVYHQRLQGEAELARAEYSKKVAVQEAQAKKDSASLLAEADLFALFVYSGACR